MSLYAQHGYGKSDKIDKGIDDKSIKGVILSPKSEKPENLKNYIEILKTKNIDILFDPQFYILALEGEIKTGKLSLYNFYINDNINKNFLSIPKNIEIIVANYFKYQNELGFNTVVSPTILFDNFDSRLSQISLSIANESINSLNLYHDNNLFISLCIYEDAFNNINEVKDFLDIISLLDVKGFYIIIDRKNNDNPNLIKKETLINIMYFMYNLSTINEYEVIIGYSDYIGIPLYCTGVKAIATGWSNTLRRFSVNDFYPRDGGRRANKRYFSNQILNSLLLIPEIQVIQDQKKLGKVLSNTKYDSKMYNDLSGTLWTDEISCLHNWVALDSILNEIDKFKEVKEKTNYLLTNIDKAISLYKIIPEDIFDVKSKSSHLTIWNEALNEFLDLIKEL